MKIIVDAMGGDNAPEEIVKASIEATKKLDVEVVLVGDISAIEKCLNGYTEKITVVHTTEIITCEDDPATSIRTKKDSSIVVGMQMLADGKGDAFVSAGSSGALVSGATLVVKRIKGIRRVAMAPLLPTNGKPTLLIDGGANADCTPEFLEQFAIMGSAYAKAVLGVEHPKVGLLNNGLEETKGNELVRQSYNLISLLPLNFVGNVEARDIPQGIVDVLVADGFSGNIFLKTMEGTAIYFSKNLKAILTKSILTKFCALLLSGGISALRKKFDYNEHGGAPILGANGVVIKAHGSSNSLAFFNAIRQAKKFTETNVIDAIKNSI